MWRLLPLCLLASTGISSAWAETAQSLSNQCPITIFAGASFSNLVHRYVVGFHLKGVSGYSAGKTQVFDSSGGVLNEYVDCDKVAISSLNSFIAVDFEPSTGQLPRYIKQSVNSPQFPFTMYYKPFQVGKAFNIFIPDRRWCKQRRPSSTDFLSFEVRHSSDPTKKGGSTYLLSSKLKPETLQESHLYYAFGDNEEAADYKLIVFGQIGGCKVARWEGAISTIYDGSLLSFQFDGTMSVYRAGFD